MGVGSVYTLKTRVDDLKSELTPNFGRVLESTYGLKRDKYLGNPSVFFDSTYVTPPLERFVKNIGKTLDRPGTVGGALERGFGFGKTHSLVFLWHLFTSKEGLLKLEERFGINQKIAKETLVLGMDFSGDSPFGSLFKLLRKYAEINKFKDVKDINLLSAVREVLDERNPSVDASSETIADILIEILEKYEKRTNKTARFLLLIDELGLGIVSRLRTYVETGNEEKFNEALKVLHFLNHLYSKAQGKNISMVVVWAFAEQDRRELQNLIDINVDKENISTRLKGIRNDLDSLNDRYRRGSGGTSFIEVSHDPAHAIQIAKFRVLRALSPDEEEKYKKELLLNLEDNLRALNVPFDKYKYNVEAFFPFSPALASLLLKLMNPQEIPKTEFIRTVIYVTALAAEKALTEDPDAPLISLKHLSLKDASLADLTGDFTDDWIRVLADCQAALNEIKNDKSREVAELISKLILSKSATYQVHKLLKIEEEENTKRYGTTLGDIYVELYSSYKAPKVANLMEILESLKDKSGRIIEYEGYYVASITTTISTRLTKVILEEKEKARQRGIPNYLREFSAIGSLFDTNYPQKRNEKFKFGVLLTGFKKLQDPGAVMSIEGLNNLQNSGIVSLIIVPPWDSQLYDYINISNKTYDDALLEVCAVLNSLAYEGKLPRPTLVNVLVPNLSERNIQRLVDLAAERVGIERFIQELKEEEKIISSIIAEEESIFRKRKDLYELLTISRESKKRILKKEIEEYKKRAQSRLLQLSRELALEVVNLYEKIIYYTISEKEGFTTKETKLGRREAEEEARKVAKREEKTKTDKQPSLSAYASIMNEFLRQTVLSLGYETDKGKIVDGILHYLNNLAREYKNKNKLDALETLEFNVNDIKISAIQGAYGVKPISMEIVERAINSIAGQLLPDFPNIKIIVKEGKLKFKVEKIEEEAPVEGINEPKPLRPSPGTAGSIGSVSVHPPESPKIKTKPAVSVPLLNPKDEDITKLQSRLIGILNNFSVAKITLHAYAEGNFKIEIAFEDPSLATETLARTMNFMKATFIKRFSGITDVHFKVSIRFSEPVPEENLKEELGDYYPTGRQSSLDKLMG